MTYRHPPAFEAARVWCDQHPGWQRYCDISDELSQSLSLTWREIPAKYRKPWKRYGSDAEKAWAEFSTFKPTRFQTGYIGDDGVFHHSVITANRNAAGEFQCSILIVNTGGKSAAWYDGEQV